MLKSDKPYRCKDGGIAKCIVCGMLYNDDFIDKGDKGRASNGGTRYLCSKDCLYTYYDYQIEQEKLAYRKMYQYELKRKVCNEPL